MQSATAMPGFERLLEVCRSRAHPLKWEPPLPSASPVAASVAGQPMDPQLAAVHAHTGYLWVRDELYLFPSRHERRPDLHRVNAHWRMDWGEPFGSLLVFAKDDRLAYCYATVPSLADARGLQPVVWVDVYETLYALPVASCVDHFFSTYARYLEATPEDSGGWVLSPPHRLFPWSASGAISQDAELVRSIQAGRFDFLMKENAQARDWAEKLVALSVRR